MDVEDWLLGKQERGNPHTRLDARHPGEQAWATHNLARPLIHGARYFAELHRAIEATGEGDLVWFTDWRGDPDELLLAGDPESSVERVLLRAHRRGVDVRGLVWRSHWDRLHFSAEQNRQLGRDLDAAGAEVLLDMRVRTFGSHHQKFVVVRHREHPERDVAFLGGIDLCHSRHDDVQHDGDPQPQQMAPEYGPTPPWHDCQVSLQGPVVHDVETVFRERWQDPAPLTRNPLLGVLDRLHRIDTDADALPPQAPPPPPAGDHVVQLLRTYPALRHGRRYPFAPQGERSVARGYGKAIERATRLIFIEDQYLWSRDVSDRFVTALREHPGLHVVVVLPMFTDQAGAQRVAQLVGRRRALAQLLEAGGDRVSVYGLENTQGTPIYVHAKVCVVDDVWATIGSDNFNVRSWTHDSELSAVVLTAPADPSGADDDPQAQQHDGQPNDDDHSAYARRLRLRLAAEHLGRTLASHGLDTDDPEVDEAQLTRVMADCLHPLDMVAAFRASADALDTWHRDGCHGERPPGQLRRLELPHLNPLASRLAYPLYATLVDPDGRPAGLSGDNY